MELCKYQQQHRQQPDTWANPSTTQTPKQMVILAHAGMTNTQNAMFGILLFIQR